MKMKIINSRTILFTDLLVIKPKCCANWHIPSCTINFIRTLSEKMT